MHYVYVIRSSKDHNFYTGYTVDLKQRIIEHNRQKNFATKSRGPFKLIYYESCINRKDAKRREIYLKTAWGKRYIKNRLRSYLTG